MELTITGVGSELQGVGRAADGRAVFVPGALPAERVEVSVIREKERFCEAKLIQVLDKSVHRERARCPYAGTCGGCNAMHMTYGYTLELKQQKVIDALRRLGGIPCPQVYLAIGMVDPYRTRNKAEYPIAQGKIGCSMANSHAIVEVEDCLIQSEQSVEALRVARTWLRKNPFKFSGYLVTRTTTSGQLMCILSSDRNVDSTALGQALFENVQGMVSFFACKLRSGFQHALDGQCHLVTGQDTVRESVSGLLFDISPQSFFQVNIRGVEALYGAALSAAALTGQESVLDAYCGTGSIALLMARAAKKVVGVEIVAPAIQDAKRNAEENELQSVSTFYCADAAKWLPNAVRNGFKPNVVCMDPPRKGVDAQFIEAVRRAQPKRVVYVSCDPATMARDIKRLCEGDRYRFEHAQPVDMFAWTGHVETVALMSRADT